MNSNKFALSSIPVWFVSIAVFLVGALALVVPSGYTYGPVLLLLPALGYLWVKPYPAVNSQDKILMTSLLMYFAVGAITNFLHHLPSSSYDNFSRFLLAIPVLLLLLRFPVKPIFMWSGIALGAIGAAVIAIIDFYVHGESRAEGYNNAIQFGDIAILFSCLLLAGFSWAIQHSKAFVGLFLIAIASGIFASLLSGARGGWLALPVAVGVFYWANGLHKNSKQSLWFTLAVVCATLVVCVLQQSGLLQMRIQEAVSDVQQYTQAQNANTSLGIRFTLWQTGLNLIAQHPLLGWGSVANYVKISGDTADVFQHFNHFHNELLDALVKRGLVGGLALLVIYCLPALLFYRQLQHANDSVKPLALTGVVLVLATFIFGLTQSFFSHSSGVMVYVFMLIILWAQVRSAAAVIE
jgi:O-antigen ligase